MSNNIDDKLIEGHEYDGIKELDNPLPGWWLATFYGTIIFAFLYYIHYTFTDAPNLQDELKTAMQQISSNKSANSPTLNETDLNAKLATQNPSEGRAIYLAKCAACHAENGGGLIGPNLTDNFWIHGQGKPMDIYKVVTEGVADKGMPAWGELLKSDEVISVIAYVTTLKGTNVPGGKPPQGNEVR